MIPVQPTHQELTSRLLDEGHMIVELDEGLANEVLRHGLIPRKAGRDGSVRMKGSRKRYEECVDRQLLQVSGLIRV